MRIPALFGLVDLGETANPAIDGASDPRNEVPNGIDGRADGDGFQQHHSKGYTR